QSGCDCGCDDEKDGLAYRVTPITEVMGGSGNIVVTNGDASITVTPEIVLGVTTYKIVSNVTNGADGNKILTGAATPSALTGNNGDLYLKSDGIVYVKASGSWSVFVDLKGATGDQGL